MHANDLKLDATGRYGISPLQKIVEAMRYIAYGTLSDSINESLDAPESTCMKAMKEFCECVVSQFGSRYLRAPTDEGFSEIKK